MGDAQHRGLHCLGRVRGLGEDRRLLAAGAEAQLMRTCLVTSKPWLQKRLVLNVKEFVLWGAEGLAGGWSW